jgi:hypothetical protein
MWESGNRAMSQRQLAIGNGFTDRKWEIGDRGDLRSPI